MVSTKKVGGIRFVRLGRLNVSFSVSKAKAREAEPITVLECVIVAALSPLVFGIGFSLAQVISLTA